MSFQEIELPPNRVLIYESTHHPGDRVPSHYHEIPQILYVLAGHGAISLQGRTYEVSRDQMVYICPNAEHSVHAYSRMTVLVLAFGDVLETWPAGRELMAHTLTRPTYQIVDPLAVSEVRDLFRKILYEQTNPGPYSDLAVCGYLLNVLVTVARGRTMEGPPDLNTHRAQVLRDYMESHYFEGISPADLAGILKLTPRHMNEVFKQKFHCTPMQYLTEVRIRRAKELLMETEKEVVSICFEVGFETLSTFYRAFKSKVGMSPQQFRKMHGKV
ncbi:MAG: AraC family transcriptional regulator [Alicyclobacillus herbarius]|uniref:AraC family transcriptional regulator n=1 Tax=Alicyclobacillus herbarius TaxID=122960 RepID=UPI00235533EC|nr:AraC family transcriptional regulator [Alicyclobacillus herbarius]MCL6633821.1 AraC family transcriptional regulator [Alicyclobacillus herbarius]